MRRTFDKEFKSNAVRLVLEENLSVKQVSDDLGMGKSTLDKWVSELKKHGLSAFPGKGHIKPEDARVKALEKENEKLKRERDILKKALAIFSSQ